MNRMLRTCQQMRPHVVKDLIQILCVGPQGGASSAETIMLAHRCHSALVRLPLLALLSERILHRVHGASVHNCPPEEFIPKLQTIQATPGIERPPVVQHRLSVVDDNLARPALIPVDT